MIADDVDALEPGEEPEVVRAWRFQLEVEDIGAVERVTGLRGFVGAQMRELDAAQSLPSRLPPQHNQHEVL